ncbi:MAG: prefoldin subunit beta [Candidatus Thermoplasmatota archaeon]
MSENEISPQLQDQINRFQQMRQQLQIIMQQRQHVEIRLKEIDEALRELESIDDDTVLYKNIGSLLVKTKGKEAVKKDLLADKETLELRKTTLEKQEGRSREKLNEMQSKIQNAIGLARKDAK